MKSILTELAEGRLCTPHQSFRRGSRYEALMKAVGEQEDKLLAAVGHQYRPLLEEIENAQGDLDAYNQTQRFLYGYRLGVLSMVEVFTTAGELSSGELP